MLGLWAVVLLSAGVACGAPDPFPDLPGLLKNRKPMPTSTTWDWWTALGPLLLLIGMGGTAFAEDKLRQALIRDGSIRWDFGRKELYGIIAGCPFFAFIMAGAMLVPVLIHVDSYVLSMMPIVGWGIAGGGLINGLLASWMMLRITRWQQPNRLRYVAAGAIWLNALAMIGHAYFLFVDPDTLLQFIGPRTAMAIICTMGSLALLLLFMTGSEGLPAMHGLFRVDWGYVRERAAKALWTATVLISFFLNLAIFPLWQFRSRLLGMRHMPWRMDYAFTYGPALLLPVALLLWHRSLRIAPQNRFLAGLSAVLLLLAIMQLVAFHVLPR